MKYQGSKERIADEIVPIMLNERRDDSQYWVEPFCGGCSTLQRIAGKRIGSDKNKYLVAMWRDLCNGREFPETISREFYGSVRDYIHGRNNDYDDGLAGWVGYMASFNGRFVDGGYSGHNVVGTNGKARNYIKENIANIKRQIEPLKGTEWQQGSYDEISIPPHSLIYCDPPYRDTKQYFTSIGFNHDKFYEWCRKMASEGHKVFVSEYRMPDDFTVVWERELVNSMNQKNTHKPTERLFTL